MKRILFLFTYFTFGAAAIAFTVSIPIGSRFLPLGFAAGSTSGHEEITRQSLNLLEKNLSNRGLLLNHLSPEFLNDSEIEFLGTSGLTTLNEIIRGNYATDMPNNVPDDLDSHLTLKSFYHLGHESLWSSNPDLQVLHFLRNLKPGDILVSQYKTCEDAKASIINSTISGIRLWNQRNVKSALFLFGHASHIIQDSFSTAHTRRADAEHNHNLQNICYYGPVRETNHETCHHAFADVRDDIWIGNPLDIIKRVAILVLPSQGFREFSLKEPASLARAATLRYLFIVTRYLFNNTFNNTRNKNLSELEIRALLTTNLFEGRSGVDSIDKGLGVDDLTAPAVMPNGIMVCSGLSSDDDHALLRKYSKKRNGEYQE